jgi:putative tricarboxylic transport membrane protein
MPTPTPTQAAGEATPPRAAPLAVSLALLVLAAGLAWGAWRMPRDAGYVVLGAHVFPLVIAGFVGTVGALLALQALRGGWPGLATPPTRPPAACRSARHAAAWLSGGLMVMALTLQHIGFVPAAALLFACAARGHGSRRPWLDLAVGVALTLPLFWLFTLGLGLRLPALTGRWI